jgi:2'-5' RNA ligase
MLPERICGRPGRGRACRFPLHARRGNVFFVVKPDRGATAKAERTGQLFRTAHGLTGDPIKPENLHVSILGLGRYPALRDKEVEAACEAVSSLTAQPVDVTFDRAMSFSSSHHSRPLVLVGADGMRELRALRQSLIMEMKRALHGFTTRASFEPHITLLYDRRVVPEEAVDPVRWTVCELVLIHSLHGLSQHVSLGRWRLNS